MRNSLWRGCAIILASLLVLTGTATYAQSQSSPAVNAYAITNARIVPVSGAVIEKGTVVIRDGLIAAVGANVNAPADARVFDGTGLTVYPGLVDALSSVGQPSNAPQRGAGGPTAPAAAPTPPPTQVPGMTPELLISDSLQPGSGESARNVGITTALSAPREGLLMGQSALINLAGDNVPAVLVKSPAALHVAFNTARGGAYPGSLMGVMAAFRQIMLDAQQWRDATAQYEKNPRGLRRPAQDKALIALQPVLAGKMPVIFHVNNARDIRRALQLAQEFKLDAMIAGGLESYEVIDELKAQKVPVLLSANFPKRQTSDSPDADPETMQALRLRAEAPKNAGRLAAAGVRFAWQSGGGGISDFLPNIAKAIASGLDKDQALRALTLSPAELFDVADRLGSIEKGKIANLTVLRGEIFDPKARLVHLFIDGQPADIKAAPAPSADKKDAPAASGTPAPPAVNIVGAWTLNITAQGNALPPGTLTFRRDGDTLNGSMQTVFGNTELRDVKVTGDKVTFTAALEVQGQRLDLIGNATVSGNTMQGTLATAQGPATFTATRPN